MTTIVPIFSKIRSPAGGIDAIVATWSALAASGDTGQALQLVDLSDAPYRSPARLQAPPSCSKAPTTA